MSSPLRKALFEAAKEGDWQRMYELAAGNADFIQKNFGQWKRVPDDVRADEQQLEEYVNGLFAIAEFFANELNDPSLREMLTGKSDDNPLTAVEAALQQARTYIAEAAYERAIDSVNEALEALDGLEGSGVRHYLPIAYGYLGECHFHRGHVEQAVAPLEKALTLCDAGGDMEGVGAYLGSLHEVYRWLGRSEQAAQYAERLADLLEQSGHSGTGHYRKRAEQVRAGEPLNRVVLQLEDRLFELDEVVDGPPHGRYRFIFQRNRLSLGGCQVWVQRGRKLASEGAFEDALDCFRQAAEIDPHDPDPHYNEGLCLMDMGRYSEAVQSYRTCEHLAPGWFHCRGDLWLAEQLAAGAIDDDVYDLLREIQDTENEPEAKAARGREAVEAHPEVAPLWLVFGESLQRAGRNQEAERAFRRGLECVEDDDYRTRLFASLGSVATDAEARRTALAEAIQINGNLVASAMARVMMVGGTTEGTKS